MQSPKRSLARRIAFASVVISILSGLGIGGVIAIVDFRRSFGAAVENNQRMLRAALPQLESAYWDLDLAAVQTTLDRLAELPLVQAVAIRDLVFTPEQLRTVAVLPLSASSERSSAPVWPLGAVLPVDWLTEERQMALGGRGDAAPIAQLEVRLSFAGLYDELGYRALSVIATTVLQALLIAAILFLLIRSRIIAPIETLSRAARSHRESGAFQIDGLSSGVFSTRREDEITQLARDFSSTVMRMERYRDHLREEVEQRTAELIVARNDALAASRAKSVFLANMSHELRTPLNAITGLSDLLLAEDQDPAARRHVADMRHAARQLLGSIDSVLDLSKLEAGHMLYDHAPYRPEEVFDEVISQSRALASRKPISIEGDIATDVPQILMGDAQKVTQILLNLASNAVKFTAKGRIRLRISRRRGAAADRLRIAVADTGTGIATGKQAAIFAPFTQGDETASRDVSGTGLGLSIARQMAEGMGGRLTLASRPGRGSLFVLHLPLEAGDTLPAKAILPRPSVEMPEGRLRNRLEHMLVRLAVAPVTTAGLELRPEGRELVLQAAQGRHRQLPLALTHRELAEAIVAVTAALRPEGAEAVGNLALPRLASRRILLIEDRQVNRAVVEALLERAGAEVVSAAGGQEALARVPGLEPDLILTDLHMPGIDGFATISGLRARGLQSVPVVALSADVSTATRQACRAAGFAGFVAKPLTGAVLLAELVRVLDGASPSGPAEALAEMGVPLDREALLRHAGGDADLARLWLQRLPAELADWRTMLRQNGAEPDVLHAIRGAAGQIGADELARACAAESPDAGHLLQLIDRLEAALTLDPVRPVSVPSLQDLALGLTRAREALAAHEMRGFDLVELLLPALDPDTATALLGAAERLDFQMAHRLLSGVQPG